MSPISIQSETNIRQRTSTPTPISIRTQASTALRIEATVKVVTDGIQAVKIVRRGIDQMLHYPTGLLPSKGDFCVEYDTKRKHKTKEKVVTKLEPRRLQSSSEICGAIKALIAIR